MTKCVFVIAGGQWQLPIIAECHRRGYKVLNTNLYEHTPGARSADYFVLADVKDKQKNLAIAAEYQPAAVLTDQSDIAVPTVAYITQQLNLPGIGEVCAERFTNKLTMRQLATRAGLPCPKFVTVDTPSEASEKADKVGYPLVVKPISSQGSRGISIITSDAQLRQAVHLAFEYSLPGEPVLIESYIDGIEYTVEGFKDTERHHSLACSKKTHFVHAPTVSSSILYSNQLQGADLPALRRQNDQLVETLELPFGITHAEYKYANGQFYLIEIAARGGGNNISSHIIPKISGINANSLLLDYALGKQPRLEDVKPTDEMSEFVQLTWFDFPAGVPVSRTDTARILECPGVIDFGYNFELNKPLRQVNDDTSRHAHIIIDGASIQEINQRLNAVGELLHVEYL